ncbi:MAG: nitrogen regulation protein NR(II) [Myxococcales bacterium]
MTEHVVDNGPSLANEEAMAPAELPPAWAWKIKWLLPAVHAAVSILFVIGLWEAGYPAWRTAAVGVLMFANTARNIVFKHLVLPVKSIEKPVTCTGPSTTAWLMGLASQFFVVGVSGGLRSPFLIAVMGPLSSMLVKFGWSRETKTALRVVCIGAAALILLPGAWFGPMVAAPWFARLAGVTLFAAIFLHSAYLIAMTRALNDSHARSDRARERMAQDALARARELEQMSAQLSHELKNPLGAIKALVQLSRRSACDEASRERLEVAENEVERMNGILQEYLSFSRPLDRLRRERLHLGALADEVLELLGAQASSAGVTLRRSGESDVEADPRRLREALFNLVANAIDATPFGGIVEVKIVRRDGVAEVLVCDSGRGMPREVLDRVGTPFFTTRDQGTGLGVAMARAAFAQHGGSLRYFSEEGRGTTVTGTLPITQERSHHLAAPAAG